MSGGSWSFIRRLMSGELVILMRVSEPKTIKGKHFAHDALFHIVSHITTAMNRSTHVALHNACLPAIINTVVCGLTKLLEKVTRRLVTANRSRVSIHLVRQYEQT